MTTVADNPAPPRVNPGPLAQVRSKSNPAKAYQVTMGKDNVLYCSCPAWRFSGKGGRQKDCKHLRDFREQNPGIMQAVREYQAYLDKLEG